MEVERSFAEKNGWVFIDLTVPLRNELQKSKAWIYGQYDVQHWSPKGTAIVADVLTTELLKVVGK